jgi:hypothetical protein
LEINFRRQCIKQDINKPWCFWNKVILCLFDGVSTLFQLYIMAVSYISWRSVIYHGGQFYWWGKLENPEKTTDLSQVTDKLCHIMLNTSPWSRFEFTTSVVIGTDCIVVNPTTIRSRLLIFICTCKCIFVLHNFCSFG